MYTLLLLLLFILGDVICSSYAMLRSIRLCLAGLVLGVVGNGGRSHNALGIVDGIPRVQHQNNDGRRPCDTRAIHNLRGQKKEPQLNNERETVNERRHAGRIGLSHYPGYILTLMMTPVYSTHRMPGSRTHMLSQTFHRFSVIFDTKPHLTPASSA